MIPGPILALFVLQSPATSPVNISGFLAFAAQMPIGNAFGSSRSGSRYVGSIPTWRRSLSARTFHQKAGYGYPCDNLRKQARIYRSTAELQRADAVDVCPSDWSGLEKPFDLHRQHHHTIIFAVLSGVQCLFSRAPASHHRTTTHTLAQGLGHDFRWKPRRIFGAAQQLSRLRTSVQTTRQ